MEFHEEWEKVAKTDRAHQAIATSFYHNEKYYNLSGIITLFEPLSIINDIFGEKCEELIILEIGCGTGRETKYLSDCFKSVISLDTSETMINKAKIRIKKDNVDLFNNQAGMLGNDKQFIEDNAIDIVYSNIVFQHCKSDIVVSYFKEAFRVLKPGGYFIFQLGIAERDVDPINFDDIGLRTKETLVSDLENCGFIIDRIGANHFNFHIAKKIN